jgi:hypothetical protein
MFHELHAGDGVHGGVGPRQFVALDVAAMKLASRRIRIGPALEVGGEIAEVRAHFMEMAQSLTIGGAKVQQGATGRHSGEKA